MYGLVVSIRNFLYNKKILLSNSFDIPLICIGNLSVGGDGKTPHTEYLIKLLQNDIPIATLSRGYKRDTRGFRLANINNEESARTIGDEPFLYFLKYKNIFVSVGENRVNAVISLLNQLPFLRCIILDDAFQHRAIHAGLNILISDYANPYFDDELLPIGRLREHKNGAERADIIIISKCDSNLTIDESLDIIKKINVKPTQGVYFTTINYSNLYALFQPEMSQNINDVGACFFFSGIAKPNHAIEYFTKHNIQIYSTIFPDHHYFSLQDLDKIVQDFEAIPLEKKYLITTEKDATRLLAFRAYFEDKNIPVYILPIQVQFLFNKEEEFRLLIKKYVNLPLFDESTQLAY